jgi:MoaA/NifB/PqqE/SkfB family radical SAM enzyme
MYKTLYFEISGKCNARCLWCPTGRANLSGIETGSYIPLETFKRALNYLLDNKIIDKRVSIGLYNWGEPLLNPNFKEIAGYLRTEGINWSFSTNASRRLLFSDPDILRSLEVVIFSMPGFSQSSYNAIHGFKLESVKRNIEAMADNFRSCGFTGTLFLYFHVYAFNRHELKAAKTFADDNGLILHAYYAYFNGVQATLNFLDGTLPPMLKTQAPRMLYLNYFADLKNEVPCDLVCPQHHEYLTIDEECNVLTCCALEKGHQDYVIGNLFDLTLTEIHKKKTTQPICRICLKRGIPYIYDHLPSPYKG